MDKNTDFSFMKSGQGNEYTNNVSDIKQIELAALVLTFAQNSIKTASIYIEHCNRTVITTKDANIAMKYEVFKFLERDNTSTIKKFKDEIIKDFFTLPQEDDQEDDNFQLEEFIEDDEKNIFIKSKCKCELCMDINRIDYLFDF